jgi:niacin transporter
MDIKAYKWCFIWCQVPTVPGTNFFVDNEISITYNITDKTAIKSAGKVINMTNQNKDKVKTMTISALLCALGILIPMTFPRIILGPASFTLASHVPVIIAMFISPSVAAFVSLVTTIGFLIAGFPPVIVLRALTHLIFSFIGAYMLKKNSHLLQSFNSTVLFAAFISIIHGIAEVAIVTYFFQINGLSTEFYEKGYLLSVVLPVGVGTFIHSLLDFTIAVFVWKPLQRIISIPANAKIKLK